MRILNDFKHRYLFPCNITIGVFNGVHLGHQLILKKIKDKNKDSIVITFKNHPLQILNPKNNIKLIYNTQQKLKILETQNIDAVVLPDFIKEPENITYTNFIKSIKDCFSFDYLIVGEDAAFVKNRLGDKTSVKKPELLYNFKLETVKKIKYQNKIISGSRIRSLIEEKNFDLA